MSQETDGLYPRAMRELSPSCSLRKIDDLPGTEQDFHFSMRCNGFAQLDSGIWAFNPNLRKPFIDEFKGQQTSFFGPVSSSRYFLSEHYDTGYSKPPEPNLLARVMNQQRVIETVGKYRSEDQNQAARVAFILGGIVRHLEVSSNHSSEGEQRIADSVWFAANMTALGERKSADAVASAMGMYVISGGDIREDKSFEGDVYHMAEAIRYDDTFPRQTADLGISQVTRLRNFSARKAQPFPDLDQERADFEGFPTVGAEFHFHPSVVGDNESFLKRLAILNMSQYQRGSYIQLSRRDENAVEVRMNPSVYPVSIANWNHLRLFLPELNHAYFWTTVNNSNNRDFRWDRPKDERLIHKLRGIGLLTYATLFDSIPRIKKPDQIDLGTVYLGQTVRLADGKYSFTGCWSGSEQDYGQLSVYAGFGNSFPHQAYHVSWALAEPGMLGAPELSVLSQVKSLSEAQRIPNDVIEGVFGEFQRQITGFERTKKINQSGDRIQESLNP